MLDHADMYTIDLDAIIGMGNELLGIASVVLGRFVEWGEVVQILLNG
jgi:hypothetical protein